MSGGATGPNSTDLWRIQQARSDLAADQATARANLRAGQAPGNVRPARAQAHAILRSLGRGQEVDGKQSARRDHGRLTQGEAIAQDDWHRWAANDPQGATEEATAELARLEGVDPNDKGFLGAGAGNTPAEQLANYRHWSERRRQEALTGPNAPKTVQHARKLLATGLRRPR